MERRRLDRIRRIERLRRHELEIEAAALGDLGARLGAAETRRGELLDSIRDQDRALTPDCAHYYGAFLRSVQVEIREADRQIARLSAEYEEARARLLDRFSDVKAVDVIAGRLEEARRAEGARRAEAEATEAHNRRHRAGV